MYQSANHEEKKILSAPKLNLLNSFCSILAQVFETENIVHEIQYHKVMNLI